ncbi:MAG: hypothetical protein ABIJ65_14640, partial [Chloroflexota bacterium]
MNETAIDPQIEMEFHKAILARNNGKEGQARVCARRAAGIAVRGFFEQNNFPIQNKSVYELLLSLINRPGIPSIAKQNAINLTMRVTESFSLPINVDLIEEARSLCDQL